MTTRITADGIEECRKCCGGHGYSRLSGLPDLFADYVPTCTYEGDNIVLHLQTARFLLKTAQPSETRATSPLMSYLYIPFVTSKCAAAKEEDFFSNKIQLDLYSHRTKRLIHKNASKLQALLSSGIKYHEAWNSMLVELVQMSQAHCLYTILFNFVEGIVNFSKTKEHPHLQVLKITAVLKQLKDLFALYYVENQLGDFLIDGYLNESQAELIHRAILTLLGQLRPNLIALVDAWNFPDFLLNSSLGRFDGDCYEHMYQWAKSNGLNKQVVLDGFKEYVQPHIHANPQARL